MDQQIPNPIVFCLCGKPHPCPTHSLTPVDQQPQLFDPERLLERVGR